MYCIKGFIEGVFLLSAHKNGAQADWNSSLSKKRENRGILALNMIFCMEENRQLMMLID